MDDFIRNVSGDDGTPVERAVESEAYTDPNGNIVLMPKSWETVSVSPGGGLIRHKIGTRRFLDCNCSADKPIGGRCSEEGCGRISCTDCWRRCQHCSIGLCPRCRREATVEGNLITLCAECLRRMKWKRRIRNALGVFFGFGAKEER